MNFSVVILGCPSNVLWVISSHVAIEQNSVNRERTSEIDWDSTMAAQRFTTSEVRQMVYDSGGGNVDSDIEIEVIIYGTFTGKSEAMRACYHRS